MMGKKLYTTVEAHDMSAIIGKMCSDFIKEKDRERTVQEAYGRGFADALKFIDDNAEKFEIK